MPFHRLDGTATTLVLDASGPGLPVCRHWGPRLSDGLDLATLAAAQALPLPPASLEQPPETTVLPTPGLGQFGQPGLLGGREGGDWLADFALDRVEARRGGLTVHAADPVAGLALSLDFDLDPATDVLVRATRIVNTGAAPYRLDWLAAGVFPVPERCGEIMDFAGLWAREFQSQRHGLPIGTWLRENRRGRTSHDAFPAVILGEPGFGEGRGLVYGFHLAWSGNHRIAAELGSDGRRHVLLGDLPAPGEIVLAPGEAHEVPQAVASVAEGLTALAANFHAHVRRRVLRWPGGAMRPRPVHFNTWEANYFQHDTARLKAQAEAAAALGVERFVLDDGWFRGRDHDRAGLGDWTPDPAKYPEGLGPLVEHVRGLGLEFGLWVEPEMVNPDSDLYRAHPDWVLHQPGRPRPTARHQLVLDLTRPEVADHIFAQLDRLLRDHPIAYLKWDMNRDLAPGASGGRAAYGAQTRAVYALLARLRAAHPGVEIESCASGGGRADYAALAHTHRIWTSDSNDALERQAIQEGFGRFFPPEVMGAHIGPSPSHTSGRQHGLAFRAATAIFGHLGLEQDVLALSEAERAELAAHIATYKRFRGLLHSGRAVRADGAAPGQIVHGVVAADGAEALFAAVQVTASPYRLPPPLRLPGLDAGRRYRIAALPPFAPHVQFNTEALRTLAGEGLRLPGAVLAETGLQLPILFPETALLLHVTAED